LTWLEVYACIVCRRLLDIRPSTKEKSWIWKIAPYGHEHKGHVNPLQIYRIEEFIDLR